MIHSLKALAYILYMSSVSDGRATNQPLLDITF